MKLKRRAAVIKPSVLLVCVLSSGCLMKPNPINVEQRYAQAKQDLHTVFDTQPKLTHALTFSEALARALKYNLDYRVKLTDTALKTSQFELAQLSMLPALNMGGSLYSRNNDLATFSVDPITGQILPTVANATPRNLRSAYGNATWNLLDFGLSYIRAKQESDRILISQEEARKQLQQLAQDVRVAYWRAYSAQQLAQDVKRYERTIIRAKKQLKSARNDKALPQERLLRYEFVLLKSEQAFHQLKFKLSKAKLDLGHLINLPPDDNFSIAAPPSAITRIQNIASVDIKKVDSLTLVNRPELRGQDYMERLTKYGINQVILEALPTGILNWGGYNYNSNRFLLNNEWMSRSVEASLNLIKLASLPTAIKSVKMQVAYEKLKRMALTMTALTETRYAFTKYINLKEEYSLVNQQNRSARNLYQLLEKRQRASFENEQQVILAGLQSLTSKMDSDLLLADLSTSLGEMYISVGFDVLPTGVVNLPLGETIKLLQQSMNYQYGLNFKDYINVTYNKTFKSAKT